GLLEGDELRDGAVEEADRPDLVVLAVGEGVEAVVGQVRVACEGDPHLEVPALDAPDVLGGPGRALDRDVDAVDASAHDVADGAGEHVERATGRAATDGEELALGEGPARGQTEGHDDGR